MKLHRNSFGICAVVAWFAGLAEGFCSIFGSSNDNLKDLLYDSQAFLFVSSPSEGIFTSRLLSANDQASGTAMKKSGPISDHNYQAMKVHPYGLALDSVRKLLFIVDGASDSNLYVCHIYIDHANNPALETCTKLAEKLSSPWVAVDYAGRAFFVSNNQLWVMPERVIQDRLNGDIPCAQNSQQSTQQTLGGTHAAAQTSGCLGNQTGYGYTPAVSAQGSPIYFEQVYDGGNVQGVNTPQGLAVDGYRFFWANGQNGKQDGTVVQGLEEPLGSTKVTPLTTNLASAHSVCLSTQRAFYADEENNIFSVKVNGGPLTKITDKMKKPRGCVFDGDGTVFVADYGADRVVSFAGAAPNLGARRMSLALDGIKEPFGVAVYHDDRSGNSNRNRASRFESGALVGIAACLFGLTF